MQGIIIVAILLNTKSATSQKSVGTEQRTLIEQSGNYPNWQVTLKFSALGCFVVCS